MRFYDPWGKKVSATAVVFGLVAVISESSGKVTCSFVPDVQANFCFKYFTIRTSLILMVQWLRIHLAMQRKQVQSLVGDLRSHIPWSN